MNSYLIFLVGLIYLGVSINKISEKNYGEALMFFPWSLANVGLLISKA